MLAEFQHFLIANGNLGMFISAFLAGTIIPFNSEVVLGALFLGGGSAWPLLIWGTLGNVIGGGVNFFIGSLGKEEWITKWTKVTPEKLERGLRYAHRYGSWIGLLAWVPVIGNLITVALGYLRTNIWMSFLMITIGKFIRYMIILWALGAVFF